MCHAHNWGCKIDYFVQKPRNNYGQASLPEIKVTFMFQFWSVFHAHFVVVNRSWKKNEDVGLLFANELKNLVGTVQVSWICWRSCKPRLEIVCWQTNSASAVNYVKSLQFFAFFLNSWERILPFFSKRIATYEDADIFGEKITNVFWDLYVTECIQLSFDTTYITWSRYSTWCIFN